MTLTEFLLARFAVDEDGRARALRDLAEALRGQGFGLAADHLERESARVLAECEAKRRIVEAHGQDHDCISLTGSGEHSVVDGEPWALWELEHTADAGRPCYVLRCLALPYADHPDWREEWRA